MPAYLQSDLADANVSQQPTSCWGMTPMPYSLASVSQGYLARHALIGGLEIVSVLQKQARLELFDTTADSLDALVWQSQQLCA